jgi:hypothetical protein
VDNLNTSSDSEDTSASERRRDRSVVIVCLSALVAFTGIVIKLSPSVGIRELMGLALVWVVLGWAAFFAASNAFSSPQAGPRPHLTVGRGIPAWAFFLVGCTVLGGIATVWLLESDFRNGLLLAGIAIMYWSISFPRPLSLRRAGLSGIGLLVSAIGLVFF